MDGKILIKRLKALEVCVNGNRDIVDAQAESILQRESFYSCEDVEKHLRFLRDQNRVLKIGVVGRVKAGKSSLINALLFDGREVLPKAATPMTAALTSIGYAEKFTANVYFFNSRDVEQIRNNAEKYESEICRAVEVLKNQLSERRNIRSSGMNPAAPLVYSADENDKFRKKAAREIDSSGALSAAADLWRRINESSMRVEDLPEVCELVAESPEALNEQLYDYVGSEGIYMPFTRELNLGLALESLKGIEVLDTPGLNDPVKSREIRTYERLKECSAAFIVSPAGQFLSAQDFELADRISVREGLQEVFVVASQVDTQFHGSELKKHNGKLPEVLNGVQRIMAQQAQSALGKSSNDVLRTIADQQDRRLLVTSGICETLLLGGGESSDQTAAHAMRLLRSNYPDYFADVDNTRKNLTLLSGKTRLLDAVKSVQLERDRILEQQEQGFVNAQWDSLVHVRNELIQYFERKFLEISNGDLAKEKQKLKMLTAASARGANALNNEFQDHMENLINSLPSELEQVFAKAMQRVDSTMKASEQSRTETYRTKKPGISGFFGRLFGGGYETHTDTVRTINTREIKRDLSNIRKLVATGLQELVVRNMPAWQQNLLRALSNKLRNTIGDDLVDIDRLEAVCRNTVRKLKSVPNVEVPELPGELEVVKVLEGQDVQKYIDSAEGYLMNLERISLRYAEHVRSLLKQNAELPIGAQVLESVQDDMRRGQEMIENKRLTTEKITRVIKCLKEIKA